MSHVHRVIDNDGTPTIRTVVITPWHAPASALPVGPRARLIGKPKVPRERDALIGRVCDHITGWSGYHWRGRPIDCTRNVVRAALQQQPALLAQLVTAIDRISSHGIL